MGEKTCAVCATPFADQPAHLVQGARWIRRRWWRTPLQICTDCYTDQRGYWNNDHRTLPVKWLGLVGRGAPMPPTPCVSCGQPVIRNSDPLLKRVTCSQSCSVSLTRSRNGGKGSGQPCETCGEPITTGRADSRYCKPACRQKAYRRRARDPHAQP
ncbi:hypothetical protein GCM10010330_16110 [Streptomyces tendae]|nr:hypothetical protein GCM10010330_16110 [Streptomyces tendae]